MKLKNVLFSLLVTVTLFSCKNEEKKETDQVAIQTAVLDKNIFTVTLTAVVKKDDSFQLFFKNDDAAPFEDKKSLFVEFKGSEQPQDIVFRLPEDEIPNFLRLDFGVNKNQSEVVIKNFKIDYLDKKIEIAGKDFSAYFYGNDLVSMNAKEGIVTPLTKNGNYDPICASAEGLRKQIEILLKP